MGYLSTVYQAIKTICIGLRVTLPYTFGRTIVVQYPEVPPTVQPRFRGFHIYEIERCIACEICARACPVDCITVTKSGPRKYDKARRVATGGAVTTYRIDYNMCLFCGLCTEGCPTDCIHMGNIHDASCYDRGNLMVDFVELAKQGRQAIEPIWMKKPQRPAWIDAVDTHWSAKLDDQRRQWMGRADDADYCKSLAEEQAETVKTGEEGKSGD